MKQVKAMSILLSLKKVTLLSLVSVIIHSPLSPLAVHSTVYLFLEEILPVLSLLASLHCNTAALKFYFLGRYLIFHKSECFEFEQIQVGKFATVWKKTKVA